MKAITARLHAAPRIFLTGAVTVLLLLASLYCTPTPARAESAPATQYPQPGQAFYYYDEPNVLGEATRADILAKNATLYEKYGVQVVVLAVNSLPAGDYPQRVAYLRGLMDNWQVGGPEGRGLLLALSIADEDYLAVSGSRLKDSFTTESLKTLLDQQLEPDFSAKNYDAGAAKFFSAAVSQADAYCAAHPEVFGAPSQDPASSQGSIVSVKTGKKKGAVPVLVWVACAAGAVAVLSIAVFVLAGQGHRRRRGSRHGVHRRSPIITPSRTNVLHYESRPTLHIRSSSRATGAYRGQKTTRTRTNIDRRP